MIAYKNLNASIFIIKKSVEAKRKIVYLKLIRLLQRNKRSLELPK